MKIITLVLSMIFTFGSVAIAFDQSEGLQEALFIRDFTDCLYKLELVAGYSAKDAPHTMLLKKLQNESAYLKEAKDLMEKWLESPNKQLKVAAWHTYGVITVISSNNSKLIDLLSDPLGKELSPSDIEKNLLEQKEYWNNLYESTGYVLWAVIKQGQSKGADQKIPFILSDKDRLGAIDYLNNVFKDYFSIYDKFAKQSSKSPDKNFSLDIPVWSALYLRSLLSAQVYADIDNIDYLKLNP